MRLKKLNIADWSDWSDSGDKVMSGCVSQEAEEGVVRKVRREGGGRGRGSDTVSGSCPNIISTALSTQLNLSATNMSC